MIANTQAPTRIEMLERKLEEAERELEHAQAERNRSYLVATAGVLRGLEINVALAQLKRNKAAKELGKVRGEQ